MEIFPAIDLIDGSCVRLYQGDYAQKTVYSSSPLSVACSFKQAGENYLHLVDLDGARDGSNANIEVVRDITQKSGLAVEIGGGIRSMSAVEKYLRLGVMRVIIGTAAVTNPDFLREALDTYGDKIAVGVDVRNGKVAVSGWTELSELDCFEFCERLKGMGVRTIICTDISKDGAMSGTNLELYRQLNERFGGGDKPMNITASGGVSTLDDVQALTDMNMYGAILGKALYTGAIKLDEALAVQARQ